MRDLSSNINVNRNRKYEPIVDRLCSRKNTYTGKTLFQFNKDLMVFAAMVGFTYGIKEKTEANPIQIVLGTYASDEKDGFIYLLALLETKDATCLKDENIASSVKYFEEYCNGGLGKIKEMLDAKPADIEGIDTLSEIIFEQMKKNAGSAGGEANSRSVAAINFD